MLSNGGLGINSIKWLWSSVNEPVIVKTELYGAVAWGLRIAERRKENDLEMKCLRSLLGVSRIDRIWDEEVRRKAGIERELASRVGQR